MVVSGRLWLLNSSFSFSDFLTTIPNQTYEPLLRPPRIVLLAFWLISLTNPFSSVKRCQYALRVLAIREEAAREIASALNQLRG